MLYRHNSVDALEPRLLLVFIHSFAFIPSRRLDAARRHERSASIQELSSGIRTRIQLDQAPKAASAIDFSAKLPLASH